MTRSLPVLLYHYISRSPGAINVCPENFEIHCQGMARAGYRGVSLERAADYLLNGAPLPKKSVLITFDDGFLDNIAHALPSMLRHGHSGTVFAVAQRLEQASNAPFSVDDSEATVDVPFVTNALGEPERQDLFMTWEQARQAEATGGMTIAAHSLTHAPVWGEPDWGALAADPESLKLLRPGARNRTFDRPETFTWGMPRFMELPGLANRAFIPSEELLSIVRRRVPQTLDLREVAAFFSDSQAVADLCQAHLALPREDWGVLETPEQYQERVFQDLLKCRNLIETYLGTSPKTELSRQCLAWPWGKYSPEALEAAKQAGFTTFFATSFGANPPAANPEHVHRFKARDKSPRWLLSRLWLYSHPMAARVYAKMRI